MRLNLYGNMPIMTPRDPQSPMEAANKNYVDNTLSAHESNLSLHITEAQNVLLDNLTVSYQELNAVAGLTGNIQNQIDTKVAKAGDTMSGFLTLNADPVDNLHAATKLYVDNQDALKVSKAGDTMTGSLTLSGDPTSLLHAAPKQYVDASIATHTSNTDIHISPDQNALLDALVVTSTEINQLAGIDSNVQTQLDAKLDLAGDTMTGTLVLAGNPVAALDAAPKQYVDAQDALKVAKAGDTMTGHLTLNADPTAALHAATKQFVDSSILTHTSDKTVHITEEQNILLDSITVTAAEINQLSGISGNVQSLLDTKFDKAGGLVTGDITLDTDKTIFVSKTPVAGTEVVNKTYVDSLIKGQKWEDPVSDINLIADNLSTPPASPVTNDVHIVGTTATGAWAGKEGFATFFNGTEWVFLQDRAVAIGDRFGVALTSSSVAAGGLTGKKGKLVTITSIAAGTYAYAEDTIAAGSTTLVFDPQSSVFGVSYTLTDEGNWTPTNTSVNLTPGEGLSLNGNILNVNYGNGLENNTDTIEVKLVDAKGLKFDETGAVYLGQDGDTITLSSAGAKVSDTTIAAIADRVSKTMDTSITSTLTVEATGGLKTNFTPTVNADVVNKGYVDAADTALQNDIDAVSDIVDVLNTDPTTKTYVDAQDALKVAKAGDTMTGALTLSGDPTSLLHAAPKQYVDATVLAHTSNEAIHITTEQNDLLDALTVTATEINTLQGVSSNVQTQIDGKVAKAGDTMTGHLTLNADPVNVLHAAPKQYVDAQDALKVNKAGDTMTGALVLPADPTAALQAATKQYVDVNLSSHAGDATLHITAEQNTFLDGLQITFEEANQLDGITSNVQSQLNSKLNLSGGTLTGPLYLSQDPIAQTEAATKQYTDTQDALKVNKAGDSMTGHLTLNADPTAALHAAPKQYVDNNITNLTTYVDNQDALKVAKAGDTMTGALTLSGAPTADLHAATKLYVDTADLNLKSYVDTQDSGIQDQVDTLRGDVDGLLADPVTKMYVDAQDATKVSKAGDTLTGYITLHADPQQNMHPATKQYVDAIAQGLSVKPAVRYASTANVVGVYNNGNFGVNSTLTGSTNGVLTVDGRAVIVNDRVLLKDQTNKAENGDYVVVQPGDAGSPFIIKRVETIDESKEVPGSYFYIYDGDTLKGTGWTITVDNPITFAIGTNNIYVNQFSGQGSLIAGGGLTLNGNTFDVNTANPTRIVVNADNIDLATTGVTPGAYTKVHVDGYGRVTQGENPNTLAGYGITDGQQLNANLTSLSAVTTTGLLARDATNTIVTKAVSTTGVGLTVNNGSGANAGDIVISSNATSAATADTVVSRDSSGNFSASVITANLNGNATTATTLQTSRNFSITGDVTADVVSFNGSADAVLTTTLTDTGVVAGTYTKVTVDAKGRITTGTTPTLIADTGVQDVYTKTEVDALVAALRKEISELHLYILSRI